MPYLALILLFFNRVIIGTLAILATAFISPTTWSRSAIVSLAAKDLHRIHHVPVIVTLVMIVLLAVIVLLLSIELVGISFNSFMRTIATIVCIALIPTVMQLYPLPINNKFYSQLLRQPWLPASTITLTSGEKIVGYILSDSGTWIEVLKDDTRTINYYLDSDIARRQICQVGYTPPMQPLITLSPAGINVNLQAPICQITSAGASRPASPSNPPIPIKGPRP